MRSLFLGTCVAVATLGLAGYVAADDQADQAEFSKLDLNEDGVLSGKEMKSVAGYDANSDGEVSRAEFIVGRRRDRNSKPKPATAKALFNQKDLNEDGVLSGKEARGIEAYDTDGDGEITLAEFAAGRARDDAARPQSVKPGPAKPEQTENPARPEPQPPDPVDPAAKAWNEQLEKQWDQGTRWAVIVGVNKYQQNPLRFCVPDAHLLAAALEKNCGYPRNQILLMTDDQDNSRLQPRRSNLQEQIAALLGKVASRDTVLVYLSGHGLTEEGQSFYCPLDFAGTKLSGWRIDELRSMLLDCPAGRKLLIIDTCHSGGAVTTSGFGATPQELGKGFETAQGLITLAACRNNQTSLESAERGHGVFTYALVAGLAGEADFDHNRIVDSDEAYRHVLTQVPILANEVARGHQQFPVRIIGQDVVGVFALSRPDGKPVEGQKGYRPGDVLENSIGMQLTILPRGITAMGSPADEYLRDESERLGPVVVSQPIVMGVHEVTQSQYTKVMGNNPSWFCRTGEGADDVAGLDTATFPVEQVSYTDALRFCEKLSQMPEEVKAGRVYRLPTEVEREYACRAGTFTPFHSGELISPKVANIRGDRPYLNSPRGKSLGRTTAIGSYPPNKFGLYDMHGNVAEWCLDRLAKRHVPIGLKFEKSKEGIEGLIEDFLSVQATNQLTQLPTDLVGELRGDPRVFRGGSYSDDVSLCRSAARREQSAAYARKTLGFRVVCVLQK